MSSQAGVTGGKGKGKGKSGKHRGVAHSRSARAGLSFPVARVQKLMTQRIAGGLHVNGSAAIYTAALMEYLTAEVLELAGTAAKELKMKRIQPRHLHLAIRGDEELDMLVQATISGGGVVPHIHRYLLSSKAASSGKPKPAALHAGDFALPQLPPVKKGTYMNSAKAQKQESSQKAEGNLDDSSIIEGGSNFDDDESFMSL